ncbi:unnamed protein product [Moneuplotes crassus]|uniref:Uncharacterized protein n=1 Tax=Euplotes crassus TaxID=5936 RepID=A0AAD1UNT1_EUPCR|nr:unnamed protein product [Moneuplotes crassus]
MGTRSKPLMRDNLSPIRKPTKEEIKHSKLAKSREQNTTIDDKINHDKSRKKWVRDKGARTTKHHTNKIPDIEVSVVMARSNKKSPKKLYKSEKYDSDGSSITRVISKKRKILNNSHTKAKRASNELRHHLNKNSVEYDNSAHTKNTGIEKYYKNKQKYQSKRRIGGNR